MINLSRTAAAGGALAATATGIGALYLGTQQFTAADTNKTIYGQTGGYAGQDTVQSTTEGFGATLLGIGGALLTAGGALGHKAFMKKPNITEHAAEPVPNPARE